MRAACLKTHLYPVGAPDCYPLLRPSSDRPGRRVTCKVCVPRVRCKRFPSHRFEARSSRDERPTCVLSPDNLVAQSNATRVGCENANEAERDNVDVARRARAMPWTVRAGLARPLEHLAHDCRAQDALHAGDGRPRRHRRSADIDVPGRGSSRRIAARNPMTLMVDPGGASSVDVVDFPRGSDWASPRTAAFRPPPPRSGSGRGIDEIDDLAIRYAAHGDLGRRSQARPDDITDVDIPTPRLPRLGDACRHTRTPRRGGSTGFGRGYLDGVSPSPR